jgi:cell wall-associated NlpC family hydrolase
MNAAVEMVSAFEHGEEPAWCAKYIGLPFKSGGRGHDGLDCWGMVHVVYREVFHREVPPYAEYADAYDIEEVGALVRGEIVTRWREVSPEQLGDVLLLRVRGQPCHVGVVVASGKFLHSFEGTQSCIERYDNLKWRRRILGFYRYVG